MNLTTQFRCNGSRAYLDWVNQFLQPAGPPPAWIGTDDDLGAAQNPRDFENWVTEHIAAGRSARITADFCRPWDSPSNPPPSSQRSASPGQGPTALTPGPARRTHARTRPARTSQTFQDAPTGPPTSVDTSKSAASTPPRAWSTTTTS
ncbi:DNA/RNA helicase domain-containing protein [Streptomyces sp. ISL-43]|uniref:DNA/RNA helicase domain-containing protein n=1 Tax=Streptomyces sp. ISL-43 TaxID=2819183 RepID=UPI0027E450BE|nr:DNA/RNA helicase domain-containing protein [Streptomyces sp. ISL-43]